MKRLAKAATAVVAAATAAFAFATPVNAATWWHLSNITRFNVEFSGPLDVTTNSKVQLIDRDWQASASDFAKIHQAGMHAVCYVDVGGWESYRPDASKYPASVLGATVGGWPDERYVDVRQRSVLEPILMSRFRTCKNKHADAVDTDLDDQYLGDIGFGLTESDYETYDKWIASDLHGLGLAWVMKGGITGDSFIKDMTPYLDADIDESCFEYSECSALAPIYNAGKPVLEIEYGGAKSDICARSAAKHMAVARKNMDLDSKIVWHCW